MYKINRNIHIYLITCAIHPTPKGVGFSHFNCKYNLQPAEIDANAFAASIMINWFGLRPQWDNVPQNVVNEINKRMKLISV